MKKKMKLRLTHFAWFCPEGKLCCEFECCDEYSEWIVGRGSSREKPGYYSGAGIIGAVRSSAIGMQKKDLAKTYVQYFR